MKKILVLLYMVFCFNSLTHGQCKVLKNYRSDGTEVHYLNPEYVGKGANFELGLSFQTNGLLYFFNTTVRYFKEPQKQTENVMLQLSNNQSLELKLYRSEMAELNGEQVALGIYYLSEDDIIKLKSTFIKMVLFKESSGKYQIVTISQNEDCAKRQLLCLEKSNL